ncbi:hypothetical protein ONE63_000094 [Megalurothrips usitatus]|uniref:Reverse transcriptase Ty1/copia-type domain-containing protein n=1 Tax=Megalurothrips usitatus TaxID=439358 RepID=A0AAV7Y2A5_9NEOP|nr:hypothetical protein ONE63_000094 [Megalurothrips usitatus]
MGLYMGVKSLIKGIQVWDLTERKYKIALHVDFCEDKFPMRPAVFPPPPPAGAERTTHFIMVSEDEDVAAEEQEYKSDTEEEKKNDEEEGGGKSNTGEDEEECEEDEERDGEREREIPVNPEPVQQPQPIQPRRSERNKKHKEVCTMPCCNKCSTTIHINCLHKPTTVEEALSCHDADKWAEAMDAEMAKLLDMDTWCIVLRPKQRVVDSKWIFKKKINKYGAVVGYKARLLLAVAVEKGWCAEQVDIDSAYLNSTIQGTVFMEQPEGFEVADPSDYVCKPKSIYGLPQSAHYWNKEQGTKLRNILNLKKSQFDECLYYRKDLVVGFHVDDFIIIGLKPPVEPTKERLPIQRSG